jgi:hypothetical protein
MADETLRRWLDEVIGDLNKERAISARLRLENERLKARVRAALELLEKGKPHV